MTDVGLREKKQAKMPEEGILLGLDWKQLLNPANTVFFFLEDHWKLWVPAKLL